MGLTVFDKLGQIGTDLAGSLTGSTNAKLTQAQIAEQNARNQQIFDLERERILRETSPEAQKQQTIKLVIAVVIMGVVLFIAYKMLK